MDGFVRTVDVSDFPFGWGYFVSPLRPVAQALERATCFQSMRRRFSRKPTDPPFVARSNLSPP